MAEGALRVGPVPLLQAGPHHVAGGGDRPGGHHPSPRRGPARARAALPRLPVRDPSCQGRGVAEGDDPAGEGPLRRHPGQARQPCLPPEGKVSWSTLPLALNAVAEWRTLDTSSIARLFPFSPPDLDTRSGTLYGIDMRACSPVVYDPWDGTHPQCQHRRPRKVWVRQIICNEARSAQGSDQGHHRLRHRPGGRVRGHGPRSGRARSQPRSARRGDEPLRHRQGGLRGDAPAHRQPEKAHRGHDRRESPARSAGHPSTTPWRATTPGPASAPASGISTSIYRRARRETATPNRVRGRLSHGCSGPSPPAASATCYPTRETTCSATRPSSPSSTCVCWSRS